MNSPKKKETKHPSSIEWDHITNKNKRDDENIMEMKR